MSAALFAAFIAALPNTIWASPAVSTQYFSRNGQNGYNYGYDAVTSQKHEAMSHNGIQGSYSFVDGAGKTHSVHYHADPIHGFKASGPDVPSTKPFNPVPNHQHNFHHLNAFLDGNHGQQYDHYNHQIRYHGPPAPLNHDGTVDHTDAVKKAREEHLKAFREIFLHRHGRSIRRDDTGMEEPEDERLPSGTRWVPQHAHHKEFYQPAPLNHDGTVADTREIIEAKQRFFTKYAQEMEHADPHWVEPKRIVEETRLHKRSIEKGDEQDKSAEKSDSPDAEPAAGYYFPEGFFTPSLPTHQGGSHVHYTVHHHYSPHKTLHHFEPAPLNHDGTVAETPEVQFAKALHFAEYHKALARNALPHHHYIL